MTIDPSDHDLSVGSENNFLMVQGEHPSKRSGDTLELTFGQKALLMEDDYGVEEEETGDVQVTEGEAHPVLKPAVTRCRLEPK
eukprot:1419735-Rhodomonas_salina.1